MNQFKFFCDRRPLLTGFLARFGAGGLLLCHGYSSALLPPESIAWSSASLPPWLSGFLPAVVPWAEIYLGGFILAGLGLEIFSLAAAAGFLLLEIPLFIPLFRSAPDIKFPIFFSVPATLIINPLIAALAFCSYFAGSGFPSLDSWISSPRHTAAADKTGDTVLNPPWPSPASAGRQITPK